MLCHFFIGKRLNARGAGEGPPSAPGSADRLDLAASSSVVVPGIDHEGGRPRCPLAGAEIASRG